MLAQVQLVWTDVIVLVRLKGECEGAKPPPTNKGVWEGKAPTNKAGGQKPQFRKCLLGLYILPYGSDEVRMSNLGVRLG